MNKSVYAVGYCRFSSDNQREESIDAQKRAISKYAEENNIIILDWYLDYAQSGTTDNRKEFKRMIQDSSNKKFSLVLVHKLDRFSRDKDDSVIYKVKLRQNGVKVFSVVERFDDTPEGVLMEAVVEGICSYYSKNLSRETLKGMKENAYKAKSNGSRPPFGYKLIPRLDENKQIVYSKRGIMLHDVAIDEDNVKGAQLIFDRVLEGKMYKEIAEELKQKGYKTLNGKDFTTSTILTILRNERYIGTYVFNKYKSKNTIHGTKSRELNDESEVIKIKGGYPQIITEEKFYAVQKLLDSRIRSSPGLKEEDYILSGKIICGECGCNFVGERQRKVYKDTVTYRTYYRCKKKRVKNAIVEKINCCNTCVRRDEIESFVINKIIDVIFSDKNIDNIFDIYSKYKELEYSKNNNTDEINKRINNLNNKIYNLTQTIAKIGYNQSLANQLLIYESDKKQLEQELSKVQLTYYTGISKEKFVKSFNNIKLMIQNNELISNQKLIDMFLNKVIVYKDKVEVFLNLLPSINNQDYGLEVELNEIQNIDNEKEVDDNSSTSSFIMPTTDLMGINNLGSPCRIRTIANLEETNRVACVFLDQVRRFLKKRLRFLAALYIWLPM